MKKDVGIDVSAVLPGNGSPFYPHGAKDSRIRPDCLKNRSTKIDVQVNGTSRSIVKRNARQTPNLVHHPHPIPSMPGPVFACFEGGDPVAFAHGTKRLAAQP
jgi:hypothetical protein